MKHTLMALLGLAACTFASAQTCSGRSPPHTVALLELYTSEGCSSCPPADRFVSALRAAGVTAAQAVPLSLHVDYWNDIGWKDPFSGAAFTARQRSLSGLAGSRTVYTPEIFVGGRELRNWSAGVADAVKRVNATPARAAIAITLGRPGAAGLPVEVSASAPAGALLQVALVQNNVSSKVTAGENGGRVLRHDFVVRQWLAKVPVGHDAHAQLARVLALPAGAAAADLAVSAFVESAAGEPLQAFSLPLCAPAG
ncbi:MAG: DUF1223 domain-containing protein [Pseudomonadota bacterium]|nr:DUF1223 domain-containing protein [Pseudomonadota bacterium]